MTSHALHHEVALQGQWWLPMKTWEWTISGGPTQPVHIWLWLFLLRRRGVRKPELVVAKSAHAAYFKAAEYFGMRLVVLPVGADMRLSGGWSCKCL